MDPLVSVIVPTYNRSEMLRRALRSVLEQSYSDLECIVVDDASTDRTPEVIDEFNDKRLIYLRHRQNRHVSAARNSGLEATSGQFISFLDDDDEWLPRKLVKQVEMINSLPVEVGMVYCWMDYYDAQGRLIKEHHPRYRGHVFPYVIDKQRIGGCPTLLVRRGVIEDVGGFDEDLRRGNDGDFIRRVALHYQVDYVPEVLVRIFTGHGHSRISRADEAGTLDAIRGEMAKLVKFEEILPKYPRQLSTIFSKIACHYGQLGDWSLSVRYFIKAFHTYPMSFQTLRYMARTVKEAAGA